jgi:hypothetical protein
MCERPRRETAGVFLMSRPRRPLYAVQSRRDCPKNLGCLGCNRNSIRHRWLSGRPSAVGGRQTSTGWYRCRNKASFTATPAGGTRKRRPPRSPQGGGSSSPLALTAFAGISRAGRQSSSVPIGAAPLSRERVLGIDPTIGIGTARGGHALGVAGELAIAGIAPLAPLQAVAIRDGPSRRGQY